MKSSFTQKLFSHFQHSDQVYFLITDTKGTLIHANEFFAKDTGYSEKQVSARLTGLIAGDEAGKCNAAIEKCLQHPGTVIATDLLFRNCNGDYFSICFELSTWADNTDKPEYIQWIGIQKNLNNNPDIKTPLGKRKHNDLHDYTTEGLWKIELRTPVSITKSPEDILDHCRANGYLSECNDKMAGMYGFANADELTGTPINELVDLDDPGRRARLFEFIRNGYHLPNIETREFDRHGNVMFFLNNVTGVVENGMLKRIWGTQQDITDQKQTQDRLHRSELFYRNLIADSLDGILLTSEKGVISFASASVQKILGYEPRDLLGKNAFDFLHPKDRPNNIAAFFEEIERPKQSRFITMRLMQKSGEWLWCMVRGHNMFSNPHVGAMLIYFCDDTLRKKAEEALIESEQRFRHLIHNLNLGVILVNRKGEILIFNQATADMFDLTEEELQGRNILRTTRNIIHEDGSPFSTRDFPVSIAIETKESVTGVVMGISRSPAEERMWLLVSAEPILDNNNEILYIISSFTNITVQKLLSFQLIEQQKQLVQATIDAQEKERREIGRELHDNISQHITTTRLYLEVAREKASGEVLSMINQAHKGLLDTVNEMRQLSQSLVPPSLSDIGLVESIEDLCAPLRNTHAFSIIFHRHLFDETLLPDNMKLMIFRIIQEQINNIIRHSHADKISINLQTLTGKVVISVADNGKGFDPASVKKGLGFANISNRASLFGGVLKITTAPGKGCSIQVDIPLLQSV